MNTEELSLLEEIDEIRRLAGMPRMGGNSPRTNEDAQALLDDIHNMRERAGLLKTNEESGDDDENVVSCRSDEGITVGVIDSIITGLRIFKDRDLSPQPVKEALLDVADDPDFEYFLNALKHAD